MRNQTMSATVLIFYSTVTLAGEKITTSYYNVKLPQNAPDLVEHTVQFAAFSHHPEAAGEPRYELIYSFGHHLTPDGCKLVSAPVKLNQKRILPIASNLDSVSPAVKAAWEEVEQKVRQHEDEHLKINRRMYHQVIDLWSTTPPAHDCRTLKRLLNASIDRLKVENANHHHEFDRVERAQLIPSYAPTFRVGPGFTQ